MRSRCRGTPLGRWRGNSAWRDRGGNSLYLRLVVDGSLPADERSVPHTSDLVIGALLAATGVEEVEERQFLRKLHGEFRKPRGRKVVLTPTSAQTWLAREVTKCSCDDLGGHWDSTIVAQDVLCHFVAYSCRGCGARSGAVEVDVGGAARAKVDVVEVDIGCPLFPTGSAIMNMS